jgi:hypothetical protein
MLGAMSGNLHAADRGTIASHAADGTPSGRQTDFKGSWDVLDGSDGGSRQRSAG